MPCALHSRRLHTLCRSQLSYSRYAEGRSELQSLTSKLSDVAVMAACFDLQAVEKDPTTEAWAAHELFVDTFLHLVSLMHAVALATLRDDYDMSNLMVRRTSWLSGACTAQSYCK